MTAEFTIVPAFGWKELNSILYWRHIELVNSESGVKRELVVLTRHGWLAEERRPRAPAEAAQSEGGRRSWRGRELHGSRRVCLRGRARSLAARRRVARWTAAELFRVRWRGAWRSTAPAAAPLLIAAGVTRAGTACRSSYRPSRRRNRCDAYSPPSYYTTGLFGIKT